MLASTREDGTVQLWDVTIRKEAVALQGHESEVWAAACSSDGLRLASGSKDTTMGSALMSDAYPGDVRVVMVQSYNHVHTYHLSMHV